MSKSAMELYGDGRAAESGMEECIYDFGVCGDWTFDDYDCSVEMLGTRDGWLPSDEQRAVMLSLGIFRAYISYAGGGAVLVNNVTGASGACSARGVLSDRSALVAALRTRLAAAEADNAELRARVERGEALLSRAARLLHEPSSFTRDKLDACVERIDAHLATAPTEPEGGEVARG